VDKELSVEVAYLISGGVASERRMSRRGERRAGLSAFSTVAALAAVAAAGVALALLAAHRVVYGPAYMAVWLLVGLGAATLAARRAMRRARVFSVGAAIDDDAFAAEPLRLVRRTADGYRLTLAPGFTGRIEGGRAPLPVEALARDGVREIPLGAGTRAELHLGPATFAIHVRSEAGETPRLPQGVVRRLARGALLPMELAALASVLCAVPVGAQLSEADMKSAIPANATPWEIEKLLRAEAQTQAGTLHRCFDVVPISCQRSGYVGVGLSLSREGEIRSHRIARSTFGADCPVNECMLDVIGTWYFEPLPESMNVILPVQVLRTDRPLPYGPARAAADVERSRLRSTGLATVAGVD
jgi:F0F1-type ATP synthase assembly protein I